MDALRAAMPEDGKHFEFQYRPRVVRACRSLVAIYIDTARGKRWAHKGDWIVIDQGKVWEVFTPAEFSNLFEVPRPRGTQVTVQLDAEAFVKGMAAAQLALQSTAPRRRWFSRWFRRGA